MSLYVDKFELDNQEILIKDSQAAANIENINNEINDLKDIIDKLSFNDIFINVKEYGAVGDGVTDDTNALIEAFSKENENIKTIVFFPKGEYIVSNPINVYSNTTILFSDEAILKVLRVDNSFMKLSLCLGEYGNSMYASEYNGVHDVKIINMKFDGGYNPLYTGTGHGGGNIGLGHCKNILFYNCEFYNMVNDHYIDLTGSYNVKIDKCIFRNTIALGADNYEAINIDWTSANGFPHFGLYDNTPCYNITIENCLFTDLPNKCAGIGTHYMPDNASYHKYITINNNTFHNMGYAITLMAVFNAIITNNNFGSCANFTNLSIISERYAIWCKTTNALLFSNNIIRDFNYGVIKIENFGGADTAVVNCVNIVNNIMNNVNILGTDDGVAIRLRKITSMNFNNNLLRNVRRQAIWLTDSEIVDLSHNQISSQQLTMPAMAIGNVVKASFLFNKCDSSNQDIYSFYGTNSNIIKQANYETSITTL